MEAKWVHKRLQLWHLLQQDRSYSDADLADHLKMSRSWVQKWRVRLVDADPNNLDDFVSQSRQRHNSPRKVTEPVVAKILHYRETLTETYRRIVGARNILYHLHQDDELKRLGVYMPKCASTVHQVLVDAHRIPRPSPTIHIPIDRPDPMQVWEIDFTDISTVTFRPLMIHFNLSNRILDLTLSYSKHIRGKISQRPNSYPKINSRHRRSGKLSKCAGRHYSRLLS